MWIATGVWAVAVAALAVTTVALSNSALTTEQLGQLVTLRHVLFGVAVFSVVWVLQAISGNWSRVLTILLAGLLIIRGTLWVTTNLIWDHTLTPGGLPVYGPGRTWFILSTNLVALALILSVLARPWNSEVARRATAWALIPASILSVVITFLPGAMSEYLMVVILSIPVLVVQAVLLSGLAVQYRQVKVRGQRDARLAEFGRQALTPGETVPAQAAVELVMDTLEPIYCEYAEVFVGTRRPIATAGVRPTSVDVMTMTIPVESAGKNVGEISVFGRLTQEDSVFLQGVAVVLSAALSRAKTESELRDQALHDPLTGLPNWALLQDRLRRLIARSSGRMVVILCCDITELKAINDEFGHEIGDAVLGEVGKRLGEIAEQHGTVARIGADEFVVTQLVDDQTGADGLSLAATTIAAMPLMVGTLSVPFEVRVGRTVSNDPAADPDRLVRDAEIALMQAKSNAVRHASYDNSAREASSARRKLVRALATALKGDEVYVEYQPILELATQRVVGVEALARWRMEDGTLVPPLDFIPLAESHGLINQITGLVLDKAFAQLVEWDREGGTAAGLRMSVNVTPNVVGDSHFIERITALMDAHGVDPTRITLEVTESALEGAEDDVLRNMHEIRRLGLRLSLDDFGTGYSTFDRLLNLPVGELKIDRRFTKTGAGPHRKIVPTVVDLAHRSELVVVAEGIETQAQWSMLLADGCEYGQGYLFSRPLNGARIPEYIRRSHLSLVDRESSAL